jgi:hypothetical protein
MSTVAASTAVPPEWPLPAETDSELRGRPSREVPSGDRMTNLEKAATTVTVTNLEKAATTVTVTEPAAPLEVIGSTDIYDTDGQLRLIPTPPPDPKGNVFPPPPPRLLQPTR